MKTKITDLIRKPWFIISAVLIVLFVCGIITAVVLLNLPAPFDGAGTADDPYVIADKEDLLAFGDYAGSAFDGHSGKYFVLTGDVDLGGEKWKPAASGARQFSGIFDGKGHTVSNFSIIAEASDVGFFSYISGGEEAGVRNLNLAGVTVESDKDTHSLGVLAGHADARIENCTVEAAVTLSGRTAYVGGIVGYTNNTVSGCESRGTMKVKAVERLSGENSTYEWPDYAGVAGRANGDLTDCVNRMTIFMTRADSSDTVKRNIHTGGICGSAGGAVCGNLVNYADIDGVGAVGGIIGTVSNERTVIKDCYNYGDLSSTGDILCDIGGIVARSYTNESTLPLVTDCYNGGDINLLSLLNGSQNGGYQIVVCWAGGIIGAGNFNVSACASVGSVTVRGAGTNYVGGVAGGITGSLKNSYHIGDILVESQSSIIAGGVLGVLQSHEYYNGKVPNLAISVEKCYNVGEVNIKLADDPLSAAANYLTGGVVGYNMQAGNSVKYNYFDTTAHASAEKAEGYTGYIYWYGEEVPGQADNVVSDTIVSNGGLTTAQLQSGEANGFTAYDENGGDDAVWVFERGEYPKLHAINRIL